MMALAAPMPLAEPVTMQTAFFSSMMAIFLALALALTLAQAGEEAARP
jgi:hypothetical protein